MKELVMMREGGALKPRDPYSLELLEGVKSGVDVMAKVWQPRNLKYHKMAWAALKMVADNHPRYTSPNQVLTDLKKLGGYYKEFDGVDPQTGQQVKYMVLDSISFYTMDQLEFAEFWRVAKINIRTFMLPGIDEDQFARELLEML